MYRASLLTLKLLDIHDMVKFEKKCKKIMIIDGRIVAPSMTAALALTFIAWNFVGGSVVENAYATHLLANTHVLSSNLPELPNEYEIASKIHDLVNQEREKNGLKQLSYDDGLASIGKGHSQDMVSNNYFGHTGSDGSSYGDRILQERDCWRADGSYYYGENIWWKKGNLGSSSDVARAAFDWWMNSPSHRANILSSVFITEGIGPVVVFGDGAYNDRVYITQDFC